MHTKATGKVLKPTYGEEKKTRETFQALFKQEEAPGDPLPSYYVPEKEIPDGPPSEEDIMAAIKRMNIGK